jgi:hypothetical protein
MTDDAARTAYLDLRARTAPIPDDELDALWTAARVATFDDLIGEWSGGDFETGHRHNGAMARLRFFGKTFRSPSDVSPLVCFDEHGERFSNDDYALGGASLWNEEFRGEVTATMVYDGQPTHDHFKMVDDDTALGIMNGKHALDEGRFLYFYLERL